MSETIAAVASGSAPSAIGVIRVSGEAAFEQVQTLYRNKKGEKVSFSALFSHTAHYGILRTDADVLDEVVVLIFKKPHSYTGEDTVEINCHGGKLVMERILAALMEKGVRMASPGEFSKRAFLNGRMDLSQAEAVMDVIGSESALSLSESLKQLGGGLGKSIRQLKGSMVYEMAAIESAIDDPEHYDLTGYGEHLQKEIKKWLNEINSLLAGASLGRLAKEGVRTVLLGKPNVGKSSLMNALLHEERAIVTKEAGTTRDTLEEMVSAGSLTLRLTDTAGIRKAEHAAEKLGVEKALKKAKEADLLLGVIDASRPLDAEDEEIIKLLLDRKSLLIFNKTDLPVKVSKEDIKKRIPKGAIPIRSVSALTGEGLSGLKEAIARLFLPEEVAAKEDARLITNLRHKEALIRAKEALFKVGKSIENALPEDFYTIDLMDAAAALGEITGENAAEELVDTIFKAFCMGK